jgi:hypothetical protein
MNFIQLQIKNPLTILERIQCKTSQGHGLWFELFRIGFPSLNWYHCLVRMKGQILERYESN